MLQPKSGRAASRRSRVGHGPGAGATALALAGLLTGSVQPTRAAQPAATAQKTPAPAAQAAAPPSEIPVIEGGRIAGQTTPEKAARDGLTVVDLSDDWLPYIFSDT